MKRYPKCVSLRGWACFAVAVGGLSICSGQDIIPSGKRPAAPVAEEESSPKDRPAWKDVEKSVKAALARDKDYKPGDLITREDAARVLADLKKAGWEVKKSRELSGRLLSGSDDLVRLLREQKGKKFMRKISGVPGGFDRLDRLRRQPLGARRIREFMNQPEGYKMIEYMATTPGGKRMGQELSSPGNDFNAPTRRIYTEQQLLAELKSLYEDRPRETGRNR